ncbi:MAG: hypothetical protein DRH08_07400 [Deltaproteobacteria bacterium]|nr:MAG: hypothetical protein DRH08_07400 [Deltaproteobacteria bacterium]
MPNRNLSEESFSFLPIDSVCRTPAVTCSADISVVAASRLMHEQNIAGLVVVEALFVSTIQIDLIPD